ncbi:unnamed protein product [Schistosoma rodhaini]|uniref:Uncharacterized protein n=1 Tax=Schistosoma rodhaini TaxID=6188 RepID=A0AA85FTQ8_9TREM|nr:unnamed protein product [Schistosoma rodhaini]CAH8562198.1 unnamed protein product [Schistosoma rodhaini]
MFYSIAILKIILITMYFNYLVAYRTIRSDEEVKHYSEDALATRCQMESEIARNVFRDTIDYRTDDPYIEDLIDIWLRKCIRSKSTNQRSIQKRPYYG